MKIKGTDETVESVRESRKSRKEYRVVQGGQTERRRDLNDRLQKSLIHLTSCRLKMEKEGVESIRENSYFYLSTIKDFW